MFLIPEKKDARHFKNALHLRGSFTQFLFFVCFPPQFSAKINHKTFLNTGNTAIDW